VAVVQNYKNDLWYQYTVADLMGIFKQEFPSKSLNLQVLVVIPI
jgi:hypothetical protein